MANDLRALITGGSGYFGSLLRDRFALDHTTLQVDHAGSDRPQLVQLEIEPAQAGTHPRQPPTNRKDDR